MNLFDESNWTKESLDNSPPYETAYRAVRRKVFSVWRYSVNDYDIFSPRGEAWYNLTALEAQIVVNRLLAEVSDEPL